MKMNKKLIIVLSDGITMKPVHKVGALIGLLFGVISTVLLIYLGVDDPFLIITLWILVPVLIKKLYDRVIPEGEF